jgi:hypothetical protein
MSPAVCPTGTVQACCASDTSVRLHCKWDFNCTHVVVTTLTALQSWRQWTDTNGAELDGVCRLLHLISDMIIQARPVVNRTIDIPSAPRGMQLATRGHDSRLVCRIAFICLRTSRHTTLRSSNQLTSYVIQHRQDFGTTVCTLFLLFCSVLWRAP